jgi:hypothetical protein
MQHSGSSKRLSLTSPMPVIHETDAESAAAAASPPLRAAPPPAAVPLGHQRLALDGADQVASASASASAATASANVKTSGDGATSLNHARVQVQESLPLQSPYAAVTHSAATGAAVHHPNGSSAKPFAAAHTTSVNTDASASADADAISASLRAAEQRHAAIEANLGAQIAALTADRERLLARIQAKDDETAQQQQQQYQQQLYQQQQQYQLQQLHQQLQLHERQQQDASAALALSESKLAALSAEAQRLQGVIDAHSHLQSQQQQSHSDVAAAEERHRIELAQLRAHHEQELAQRQHEQEQRKQQLLQQQQQQFAREHIEPIRAQMQAQMEAQRAADEAVIAQQLRHHAEQCAALETEWRQRVEAAVADALGMRENIFCFCFCFCLCFCFCFVLPL